MLEFNINDSGCICDRFLKPFGLATAHIKRSLLIRLRDGKSIHDKNELYRVIIQQFGCTHLKNKKTEKWKTFSHSVVLGTLIYRLDDIQLRKSVTIQSLDRQRDVRNILIERHESLFLPQQVKESAGTVIIADYDQDPGYCGVEISQVYYQAIKDRFDRAIQGTEKFTKSKKRKVLALPSRLLYNHHPGSYREAVAETILIPLEVIMAGIVGRYSFGKSLLYVLNSEGRTWYLNTYVGIEEEEAIETIGWGIQFGVDCFKDPTGASKEEIDSTYAVLFQPFFEKLHITEHPFQWSRASDNHLLLGDDSEFPQGLANIPEKYWGVSLIMWHHAMKRIHAPEDYQEAQKLWKEFGSLEHIKPQYEGYMYKPEFQIYQPIPGELAALLGPAHELPVQLQKYCKSVLQNMRRELHTRFSQNTDEHHIFAQKDTSGLEYERTRINTLLQQAYVNHMLHNHTEEELETVDYAMFDYERVISYLHELDCQSKNGTMSTVVTYFASHLALWFMNCVPYKGIYIHESRQDNTFFIDKLLSVTGKSFPLIGLNMLWKGKEDKYYCVRFDQLFEQLEKQSQIVVAKSQMVTMSNMNIHGTILYLQQPHNLHANETPYTLSQDERESIICIIKNAWGMEGTYKVHFYKEGTSYYVRIEEEITI